MTDHEQRDELIGWRLYYLHRGRLCSPLAGDLAPVERDAEAVCLHPQTGEIMEAHTPPAEGCYCGWRVSDNIPALVPAAKALNLPVEKLPVRAKLATEHGEPGSVTVWGWPMDVLRSWDWPAPALVRVRAHGGVRPADDVHLNRELIKRVVERRGDRTVIDEGPGMWRARRVQIIGPILTGNSPTRQFTADPRDVAEHYGVTYHHYTRTWDAVMAAAVAGRIAPRLLGEDEAPSRARTGQRTQPRRKNRTKRKAA